ncbi:MAG: methyltransferase domain-containing protein [Chloroflexota bacterium]
MSIDYDAWAQTYDDSRGASPSVLNPIREALGEPTGRSLLDIGGGTGNFALPLSQAGFRVTLADYSPAMVRQARRKLPDIDFVVMDGSRLPFEDGSFDCAVSVNVLGHIAEWRLALKEARRVLRGGPLVLKVSTRETVTANWVMNYFPALLDAAPLHHYQPASETVAALRDAGFADVQTRVVHYTDTIDGSFQALKHDPRAFLENEDAVMNTAVLKRVPERERREALDTIRRDYASGRLREIMARFEPLVAEYGDGFVFVARP